MGLLSKSTSMSSPAAFDTEPIDDIEKIPIPQYQFAIEIDAAGKGSKTIALFQNVSGISVSREPVPLKVGGENDFGREFPGPVSFGHITLETGLTDSNFFWKWMMAGATAGRAQSINFTLIQRRPNPDLNQTSLDTYQSDAKNGVDELATIKGAQEIFVVVKQWNFVNAFPVSWKLGDLSLDNSEAIALESLELSFDYFELAS